MSFTETLQKRIAETEAELKELRDLMEDYSDLCTKFCTRGKAGGMGSPFDNEMRIVLGENIERRFKHQIQALEHSLESKKQLLRQEVKKQTDKYNVIKFIPAEKSLKRVEGVA